MPASRFDSFNTFIRKRRRLIIVAWIVAVIVSLLFIPSFFSSVSYNVTGGLGGPTNTESQRAANILAAEFPGGNNGSSSSVLLVFQGSSSNNNVFSNSIKSAVLDLNRTFSTDPKIGNYTGFASVYTSETGILNSSLPSLLGQVAGLEKEIASSTSGISFSQAWNAASGLVANGTRSIFSRSPLFQVNSTSLQQVLASLPNATSAQVNSAVERVIGNTPFADYPYIPSRSLTQNFVSKDNGTMIAIFNFSNAPSSTAIDALKADVANSDLSKMGTTYVTGSSVLSKDLQGAFTPALTVTVGPGVAVSLLIVALLFLSPIAAIIPVLMGGISISIALAAIYVGIVKISHGSITFLTPTLTILLVLGLAVDYAVLQLRRTREERLNGRSTEDSVGISVKWAGQAVLTAGVTVIVAYIVMAVANVPLFSDVGVAIAIGVSVLLAASLTLLPALELSLSDRIFWPGLHRQMKRKTASKNRLEKLARATLKRKVAIAAVISTVAVVALYTTYSTPTGSDFLKLIPNFPSNQGLTVITNNLGSGTIAPVTIILTTPSPIVQGNGQFNPTAMNEIEIISNAVANSSGVVSISGPTRPYGLAFDYNSLGTLSQPVRVQYLSGILSYVGKDNKTALIKAGLSSSSEGQAAINSLLGMEANVQKEHLSNGDTLYFGGDTQGTYDSNSFLNTLLPQIVLILAAAVYVILFIQLRSALTPVRLIFTILCSVIFSLAILSAVFYYSLNLPILNFAPLFVVVTMLGVGIDYDIFFVTRIREEVLNGKSDTEAIVTAVDRVWVTILGLGLVLSTVFASLLITGIAILQEISLAVSAAILVDVLVVILFFVPSLMGLAQRWNWWPTKIKRLDSDKQPEKLLEAQA